MYLVFPSSFQLYQLVVDTETTSRLLLDNGKLSRRSTIIILNKITPRTVSDAVVKKAKALVRAIGFLSVARVTCINYKKYKVIFFNEVI